MHKEMFGLMTSDALPNACKTDQTAWDYLIANVWHALFNLLELEPEGEIVEIGPGTSAKVAFALSRHNYRGKLYVVDNCPKSIKIIQKKYSHSLLDAKIYYLTETIQKSLDSLPKEPNFIIANHVLDDMIIAKMVEDLPITKKNQIVKWSTHNNTYDLKISEVFKEEWEALVKDTKRLDGIKGYLKESWIEIIKTLNPQYVILSQYPSATLYENGLNSLNQHTGELFNSLCNVYSLSLLDSYLIQRTFNTIKNYNDTHLGVNILNAHYWMVYKRQ